MRGTDRVRVRAEGVAAELKLPVSSPEGQGDGGPDELLLCSNSCHRKTTPITVSTARKRPPESCLAQEMVMRRIPGMARRSHVVTCQNSA
jgi:hypothetical protein